MGTSFVQYNGFGFWARDAVLGDWLTSLSNELEQLPQIEPWQASLAKHWREQSTIDAGCISVDLDNFITNEAKKAALLSVARIAIAHSDSSTHRTGELFIDLLEGRLKTTASSPIDYLSGPGTS